jgi:hypothetical protein
MSQYFPCPQCGARVPLKALACPECGSDERTGWSDAAATGILPNADEDDEAYFAASIASKKQWYRHVALGLCGLFLVGFLALLPPPAGYIALAIIVVVIFVSYYAATKRSPLKRKRIR